VFKADFYTGEIVRVWVSGWFWKTRVFLKTFSLRNSHLDFSG